MAEHRVPMLGAALRRYPDPARSRDPRVRELVGALATLELAPAPRADFRAELRAQLVAVTPRLVAEGVGDAAGQAAGGADAPAADPKKKKKADKPVRERPGFRFAKPLIATACVLGAFLLLLGGAVWISQKALPGDALYGLKRARENTEYGLASGTVDKGKLKLEFAAHRIGEVRDLLPRAASLAAGTGAVAGGGLNASTRTLVAQTLSSADGDIRSAAQMLGTAAVTGKQAAPLDAVTSWAPAQESAMKGVLARIPAGDSTRAQALQTLGLIERAAARAAALRADLGCGCLDPGTSDDLGPLPAGSAEPGTRSGPGRHTTSPGGRSGTSGAPAAPGTRVSTAPGVAGGGQGTTGGGNAGTTPAHGGGTSAGHGSSTTPTGSGPIPGGVTPPHVTLPPLSIPPVLSSLVPTSVPTTLPVSINSCGIHASLGPIHIGVGGC